MCSLLETIIWTLESLCILIFGDVIFYCYQFSLIGLLCHLGSLLPYRFSDWMIFSLMSLRCLSSRQLLYYCQFLPLCLWVFAFYIYVLLHWVHSINEYNILFLYWSLYHLLSDKGHYLCPSLFINVSNSTLSDICIAIPTFFLSPYDIFFHPLTFSLCI